MLTAGGDISYNGNPGALKSSIIEIDGTRKDVAIEPFGTPNEMGIYQNGVFDLTSTSLAQIATSEIALSDFTASFYGMVLDQVSITEVMLDGTPVNLSNQASIAKCKKDGWKSLGFKNQGDCVQFVLTGR